MKPNILIVDDKPENLLALESILEDLDVSIFKAQSGNEAIELTLKTDFALMLLDVQMPEMNGFETAEMLRSMDRTKHLYIIFLTAICKEDQYVFKGYEVGGVDFISKPVDDRLLLRKVGVFLELFQKRSRLEEEMDKRKRVISSLKEAMASLEDANREIDQLNDSLSDQIEEKTRELRKAKEAAEKASKFKSEFLANISHDLRTPLHVILGTDDLLLKRKDVQKDEALFKSISIVNKSGERLLNLVNDILDISKLETGKVEIQLNPFDTDELFMGLPEMVTMMIKDKPIEFKLEKKLPEHLIISSDKQKIDQIITNLLSNAVKFTKNGQITLKVYIEDSNMFFEVKDTGIGIDSNNISMLFNPYSQIENEFSFSQKGTGLGLYISKHFVENMGGRIKAESELGKGSTFIFWIPYIESQKSAIFLDTQQELSNELMEQLSLKKIILCDDDEFNREFARMLFDGKIKDFVIAENGFAVIEAIKTSTYDLVLLDVQMPEMDGRETLKRIREFDRTTIISALTAQAMKGTKEELISHGFQGYLSKPFTEDQLFLFISKTLHLI